MASVSLKWMKSVSLCGNSVEPLKTRNPASVIEEPPPERHRFAGEIGIDLVEGAIDPNTSVARDLAGLRLAGEGAEALP